MALPPVALVGKAVNSSPTILSPIGSIGLLVNRYCIQLFVFVAWVDRCLLPLEHAEMAPRVLSAFSLILKFFRVL